MQNYGLQDNGLRRRALNKAIGGIQDPTKVQPPVEEPEDKSTLEFPFSANKEDSIPQPQSKPTLQELTSTIKTRRSGPGVGSAIGSVAGMAAPSILGKIMPALAVGGAPGMALAAGAGLVGSLIPKLFQKGNPNDVRSYDARQLVGAAYRDLLGREGSAEEIDSHLRNNKGEVAQWIAPTIYQHALSNIQGSEEAQKYAALQQGIGGTTEDVPPPEDSGTDEGDAALAEEWQRALAEGGNFTGWYSMPGFEDSNMAGETTPKYVFARIAQKYDLDDPAERAAMLAELRAHPSRYFEDAVLEGKGDLLRFTGRGTHPDIEGTNVIDMAIDLGTGNAEPAWQVLRSDAAGISEGSEAGGSSSPLSAAISGNTGNPLELTTAWLRKLLAELGVNF